MTTATRAPLSLLTSARSSQNTHHVGGSYRGSTLVWHDHVNMNDGFREAAEATRLLLGNALAKAKPVVITGGMRITTHRRPTPVAATTRTSRLLQDENRAVPVQNRRIAPLPRPRKSKAKRAPALEDWTADYVFDDDSSPLLPVKVLGQTERLEVCHVDRLVSSSPPLPPVPEPLYSCNCVVQRATPGAARLLRPSKTQPRGWTPPGSSPLSAYRQPTPFSLFDALCHDQPSLLPRPLKIRPLPRTLGSGRAAGRVSPSLRHALTKHRILRRVSYAGLEDPELDFLDERSIDFVLDTQAALHSGFIQPPNLQAFARGASEPPRRGTPARSMKWGAHRQMPWRVMDYAKAAERMLERRRAADLKRL